MSTPRYSRHSRIDCSIMRLIATNKISDRFRSLVMKFQSNALRLKNHIFRYSKFTNLISAELKARDEFSSSLRYILHSNKYSVKI